MFELIVSCFDIQRFGVHEESLFHRPELRPTGPYASKRPTDMIHATRVMRWDPALHVLYMQRDPRDAIVSQHGRFEGRYWCDFDIWRRNQDLLPRLEGHPRFFLCHYEALVADPDGMQAALQTRFGFLRPIHAFSRFQDVAQSTQIAQVALNGVRKVAPVETAKWRGNLPRIAAQVQRFPDLPDYLIAAGYETNRDWLAVLDGVTPDPAESVRAEHNEMRGKGPLGRAFRRLTRRLSSLRMQLVYGCRARGLLPW